MDSLSTGIVRIVIEDAGGTLPSSRPASKGGSYDPNAAPRQSAQPDRSAPAGPPVTPSMSEKIAAILKDPGAKQSLGKNTSAAELAKIGPEFVDLLFSGIQQAKDALKPVGPAPLSPGRSDRREDEPPERKSRPDRPATGDVVPVRIVGPNPVPVVIAGGSQPRGSGGAEKNESVVKAPMPAAPKSLLEPDEPEQEDFDWLRQMVQPAPRTLAEASEDAANPAATNPDEWYPRYRELQNRRDMGGELNDGESAELQKLTEALHGFTNSLKSAGSTVLKSPEVEQPAVAKPESKTFRMEGDPEPEPESKPDTFGLKKPTAYPVPKPEEPKIPLADSSYSVQDPEKPKPKLPRAEPVSDAEKSRNQWKPENLVDDFKNYLPAGLGKKLDVMKDAYGAASKQAGVQGAGMAGRAAAGAGEAMIAAGPVAALAAVTLAAHLSAKAHQKAADAVEGMGNQAARFAANDHLGMFNAAVDGAKDTLREIPIVGEKYAAQLSLAVAPIKAFTTAVSGFVARGKELSGFSGQLASANARADVRALQGDIREAKELGPALARLTEVESRATEELRALLLPIKENVVKFLAMIAETALDGWEFGKPVIEGIGKDIRLVVDLAEKIIPLVSDPLGLLGIKKIIEDLKAAFEKGPSKEMPDPIVDWLNAADGLGRDPWAGPFSNNSGNPAQRQVAGPMFPGFGDVLGM